MRNQIPFLALYLKGREDASEEFSAEDYDCKAIVKHVVRIDQIHATAAGLVADELAEDVADGLRKSWFKTHEDDLEEGDSPEKAYDAWACGYKDEATGALEAEIVNALVELAEEDTAVETPSSKARGSKRNPSGDGGSYAAWFQTGIQDCENTFDATDLDDEIGDVVTAFQKHRQDIGKLAAEAVKAYWNGTEPESKQQWMSQHEHEVRSDRLKPDRAYEFWADGWRTQAQKYVAEKIVERAED